MLNYRLYAHFTEINEICHLRRTHHPIEDAFAIVDSERHVLPDLSLNRDSPFPLKKRLGYLCRYRLNGFMGRFICNYYTINPSDRETKVLGNRLDLVAMVGPIIYFAYYCISENPFRAKSTRAKMVNLAEK